MQVPPAAFLVLRRRCYETRSGAVIVVSDGVVDALRSSSARAWGARRADFSRGHDAAACCNVFPPCCVRCRCNARATVESALGRRSIRSKARRLGSAALRRATAALADIDRCSAHRRCQGLTRKRGRCLKSSRARRRSASPALVLTQKSGRRLAGGDPLGPGLRSGLVAQSRAVVRPLSQAKREPSDRADQIERVRPVQHRFVLPSRNRRADIRWFIHELLCNGAAQ